MDLPRASYRTGTVVHASAELKMFHRAPTLLLGNDLSGCAELGPPVMAAADGAQALQRLLVDAALLFVADHSDRFAPTLVAELPGIGGGHGASPFWQGLGRHFHPGPLPQDSALLPFARAQPPRPPDAQTSALQRPARARCPGLHRPPCRLRPGAGRRLHAQGLRHRGQVNLFDAGPVLEAEVADLAAVRRAAAAGWWSPMGSPRPTQPLRRCRAIAPASWQRRNPPPAATGAPAWCLPLPGEGRRPPGPRDCRSTGSASGQPTRVLAQT